MKKDAYYFPHDSNAKDDPKCVLLIEQLGLEGYGIFWVLVETLRDQKDYKYPIALLPAIARRYNTSLQKVEAVVKAYSLFDCDDNSFFFSKSLILRMIPLEQKRLQASEAGKISAKKRNELKELSNGRSTTVQRPFNDRTNDRSTIREEKNIIKEIKEKNILSDVLKEKEPTRQELEKFWGEQVYEYFTKKYPAKELDPDKADKKLESCLSAMDKKIPPVKNKCQYLDSVAKKCIDDIRVSYV